jgi:hypothetical protein
MVLRSSSQGICLLLRIWSWCVVSLGSAFLTVAAARCLPRCSQSLIERYEIEHLSLSLLTHIRTREPLPEAKTMQTITSGSRFSYMYL